MDNVHVAICPEGRIFLNDDEHNHLLAAVEAGSSQAIIGGHIIGITSALSTYGIDQYISMQNAKLNPKGMWMCRSAVVHEGAHCDCDADSRLTHGERLIRALPSPAEQEKIPATRTISPTTAAAPGETMHRLGDVAQKRLSNPDETQAQQ